MDFFWGLERLFYFLRFGSVAGVDRGLERGAVGVKGRQEAVTMMTTQLWEEYDNEQRSHRPVFGLPREAYDRPTVIQESVLRPCLLGAIEKISLHPGKRSVAMASQTVTVQQQLLSDQPWRIFSQQ